MWLQNRRTAWIAYMASDDPPFEEKATDIIGLYMNPPQFVDEKTAI